MTPQPCTNPIFVSHQPSVELLSASRSVVMIAASLIFFLFAMVLCGLSFLPQVTLPFSGAYFVIGSSLIFVALGILIVNLVYDLFPSNERTSFQVNG